jgi:hypothetical protein
MSVAEQNRPLAVTPVHFQVLGPDNGGVAPADLRRLFPGQRLTAARRNRLGRGGRILAMCGSRVVGMAAYDRAEGELRVYEIGMDPGSSCGTDEIASGLLDALELACMASGARRLLLSPRAALTGSLMRRRGYVTVGEATGGAWIQKTFV